MKKLLVASVLLNVGLAVALAVGWQHSTRTMRWWYEASLRAEETHVNVHAKCLTALEAEEPEDVEELKYLLRHFVESWEEGAEIRETMRQVFK